MQRKYTLYFVFRLIIILIAHIPFISIAQENTVKFNFIPIITKTFAFEYEKKIAPKMTINTSLGFRGKSALPMKEFFKELVQDHKFFKNADLSHFTLTPELRFYTSKGRAEESRGVYVGPFIKYGKYNLSTDYEYASEQGTPKHIAIHGSIGTWSTGIVIGCQFTLDKSLFLDFRIFGPHVGFTTGEFKGKASLSAREQEELRNELNKIDNNIIKTNVTVDSEGATINSKTPWAGFRTGLSLGYRF